MKKRTKRRFLAAVVLVALGVGAAFLIANRAFAYGTQRIVTVAPTLGKELGLVLQDLKVEVARVNGVRSAAWNGVSAKAKVVSANTISRPGAEYFLTADYIGTSILSSKRLLIEADGIRFDPIDGRFESASLSEVPLPEEHIHGRVAISSLQFVLDIDSLFAPSAEARKLIEEFRSLLTNGYTKLGMTVEGKLTYTLGEKARAAKLHTDLLDGKWYLKLDRSDLSAVSLFFDEPLVEAEVALLAQYPFRAAKLLEIREQVKNECRVRSERSRSFPEEAFRHVAWSYLLTRAFGEEFAQRLLTAYQQSVGATPAKQAQNYNNQRVGREWASEDISIDELAAQVEASDEVIRIAIDD